MFSFDGTQNSSGPDGYVEPKDKEAEETDELEGTDDTDDETEDDVEDENEA